VAGLPPGQLGPAPGGRGRQPSRLAAADL